MTGGELKTGKVYTETVVFAAPQQYAEDAPYQIAIIDLPDATRTTVRIIGKSVEERANIGDTVIFVAEKDGVSYYRKAQSREED